MPYIPEDVSPSFSQDEWAKMINRSAKEEIGTLLDISGETVGVKLLKKNHQTVTLDTEKIIDVSLELFPTISADKREKFSNSLHKIAKNISKYLQTEVDAKTRRQLLALKNAIEDEFPKIEEVSAEATPEVTLNRLINQFDENTSVEMIREVVKNDLNLLFVSNEDNPPFLNQLIDSYRNEPSLKKSVLPLFSELIKNLDRLTPENQVTLVNRLFRATNPTLFVNLMETEENNLLYDLLVTNVLTETFLNENPDIRTQIYVFGFSPARYEAFWVTESQLMPGDLLDTNKIYQQFLSPEYTQSYSDIRQSQRMDDWIGSRMSISSTLNSQESKVSMFRSQWLQVEQRIYDLAVSHRESDEKISLEEICEIHRLLMSGEIDEPGMIRGEIVRSTGGTFTPPVFLNKRLEQFFDWFNSQCELCDRGEVNPILFAFETTQKFVSYHPFLNGNGRISALLMDYVLQRYSIPPPIIDRTRFLQGVFPLKCERPNHALVYSEYIRGLKRSLFELGLERK